MKKSYTIAGIGVCLGGKPGYEILAESVITGSSALGAELADSLNLAVQEALRYTGNKNLPVITDTQAPELGEQKICGSFHEMLENAPENVLLLSHRENG